MTIFNSASDTGLPIKETLYNLLLIIGPHLHHHDRRGTPLTPAQQLFLALRFYATGSFHRVTGDLLGVHESTASRAVDNVTSAIYAVKRRFIFFPTQDELPGIALDFAMLSRDNFPGIIGAVDCTHIRITCPNRDHAGTYINRKCFYSVNVQVICDANMKIRNIVARWPGSTHDSRIFRASRIKDTLEAGNLINGHLVGDSGYGCKRYLLTPIANPITHAQTRYNTAHCKARNVIERTFGVSKKCFPCLAYGLRTKINRKLKIIVATAILHNLAVDLGEVPLDANIQDQEVPLENVQDNDICGNMYRQQIIDLHFMA